MGKKDTKKIINDFRLKGRLVGDRLYLRRVRLTDANENYCRWLNDPEVTQFSENRFKKWTIKEIRDYIKKINNNPDYCFVAIVLKKGDKHIGNIKLGPVNRYHKYAEIATMIGDKTYWNKGYGSEAKRVLIDYVFKKVGLHKITSGMYINHIGAIKSNEKLGFSREGIRKKQVLYQGKYTDVVLYGLVNE